MKTKILFLATLLLITYKLEAQSFCFTPNSTSSTSMKSNTSIQMRTPNNNYYCLKVYFHVIRRSNGTRGQTTDNVNEGLRILNQDFKAHKISFSWDNQIDYIDSDTHYSTPTIAVFNINNHQNGIDIYLFDGSSSAGGSANGVGKSSELWVSGNYWKAPYNSLVRSHVISHEMGHVFFLWHTHHGTYNEGGNDSPCSELVNGSNSSTCGDYVEDTPADPNLRFNVNKTTCQWNSSATDSNGDFYNPDERLIMSYSDINCMRYFSAKQGSRMRNSISTLSHLKKAVVVVPGIVEYFNVSLSPNPADTHTGVTVTRSVNRGLLNPGQTVHPYEILPFTITLTNCSNVTVFSGSYTMEEEREQATLVCTRYPSGVYVVTVSSRHGKTSKKLIISH